jgi:mannan endo-1,4-beta-mannosidase
MDGFKIHNQQLLDGNNNAFLLRGVNEPHAWYTSHTQQALGEIAAKGANCVRVVLATGYRWTKTSTSEITNIIQWCKANKLIAVLEVHDCTGYGDESAAAPLSNAADYWISVASALKGEENYVIINLANEPIGNNATAVSSWSTATSDAVVRMRQAGLTHTIMIDAPNWGQDWSGEMVKTAALVWAADSLKNLVFSVHMYGVYTTYDKVDSYLSSFQAQGLPLVVGEFANADDKGVPVVAADIMERCDHYQLGYMGWSWCGNSTSWLDLVNNWNPANQSTWGNLLFDGAQGIRATAKTCSVFN